MCIVNIKVNEEKPHDMTVEDLYTTIEKDIKAIYEEPGLLVCYQHHNHFVGACYSQNMY